VRRYRYHCSISIALALACGSDEPSGPAPAFPADYAASYVEVRDCRLSGEHELSPVRVFADPDSADAYSNRDEEFSEGAVLVKAEYDFSDPSCEGEIQRWTVMLRDAERSSADTLDWYWQDVDAGRNVVSENDSRCVGCHTGCGVPPEGYQGTCSVGASFGEREAL
jgi:hypothetical protein